MSTHTTRTTLYSFCCCLKRCKSRCIDALRTIAKTTQHSIVSKIINRLIASMSFIKGWRCKSFPCQAPYHATKYIHCYKRERRTQIRRAGRPVEPLSDSTSASFVSRLHRNVPSTDVRMSPTMTFPSSCEPDWTAVTTNPLSAFSNRIPSEPGPAVTAILGRIT